jgi:hypothetical protein
LKIAITKPVGNVVVAPTVRWTGESKLSDEDRAALAAYTQNVESTIRGLALAVKELQQKLDGVTVG